MSYPCVKQKDQADCGPAALATVALYHKLPVAVSQLRDLAGTDRTGTNLRGMVEGAEKLGFSARALKGPFEALDEIPLPAIVHWVTEEGLGHFVVLYKLTDKAITIADPGRGVVEVTPQEFRKRWTGYLIVLTPDHAVPTKVETKAPLTPWRRFMGLLKPHRGLLVEAIIAAILVTMLGLSTSYFVQHLVDSVLVRGEGKLLNAFAVGMIAILVFRCAFGLLRQYLLVHVGRKVDLSLISHYARHVLGQPVRFFESRRVGEILSRVNDAVNVREAVSGVSLTVVVDSFLVIVSLVVMFFYDWRLALIAVGTVPIFLAIVWSHHPAAKKRSREAMEHAAGLQSHLVEDISGVDSIKAFGAERRRSEEGEERLVKVAQSGFSVQMIMASLGSFSMLLTAGAGIALLWIGGHRVIGGALTIGELMFFYTLLGYMLDPLERLSGVNVQIQEALVALDRLGEVLDLETEKLSEEHKSELQEVRQGIELKGVTFRYGCREEVLKGIDLVIPAGSKVALVGESGCGKSTLLKLLMRFYDPTQGQIQIDGTDIRDYTLASLRSKIGVVSQEPFLFNGTIRDNIAFGRPEAKMDEIVAAAKAAGLEEFINALPQRYETVIGERGMNFSGGQRQRLAIARVLVTRPEILLFDEATSHLDTATERAIQASLESQLSGKTVVMVAHRLSTIRDADLICVVEGGQIVEGGTHEELMELDGRYATLVRSQSVGEGTLYLIPCVEETVRKVG